MLMSVGQKIVLVSLLGQKQVGGTSPTPTTILHVLSLGSLN